MARQRIVAAALIFALSAVPGTPGGGIARASEGGGEGGGGAADPTLVPMTEIAVPITDADQLDGVLRFTLVVQANDAAAAHEVGAAMPRLRAAALAAGLEFARLRASPWRPVDVAHLSQGLDAALRAADHGVKRALIVRVMASEG